MRSAKLIRIAALVGASVAAAACTYHRASANNEMDGSLCSQAVPQCTTCIAVTVADPNQPPACYCAQGTCGVINPQPCCSTTICGLMSNGAGTIFQTKCIVNNQTAQNDCNPYGNTTGQLSSCTGCTVYWCGCMDNMGTCDYAPAGQPACTCAGFNQGNNGYWNLGNPCTNA